MEDIRETVAETSALSLPEACIPILGGGQMLLTKVRFGCAGSGHEAHQNTLPSGAFTLELFPKLLTCATEAVVVSDIEVFCDAADYIGGNSCKTYRHARISLSQEIICLASLRR